MPCLALSKSVKLDAELFAVFAQCVDLLPRDGVGDRQPSVRGGDVVVRRSNGAFRADALGGLLDAGPQMPGDW